VTIVGNHAKAVTFLGQDIGYFLLTELCDLSGNNHSEACYIIASRNVWSGAQKMGLVLHKLHIT